MIVRLSVAAVCAVACVGLSAAAAGAAPASSAPSVANSSQTQYFHAKKSGGYKASVPVVFTASAFTVPSTGDSGSFSDVGNKLTMTVHHSNLGDSGCVFKARYHSVTTLYAGTYTCPGGYHDTFAVTTAGS